MILETADLFSELEVEAFDIPLFSGFGTRIYLVRVDRIKLARNSWVGGNKVFKLLPNIQSALDKKLTQIISFGGSWSNHLHALAAAGEAFQLKTVGIVRGERSIQLTPTLRDARDRGMRLQFVTRQDFRDLQYPSAEKALLSQFGDGLVVPVGGSNVEGLLGTLKMGELVLQNLPGDVADIWLPTATGGTHAGMAAACLSAAYSPSKTLETKNLKRQEWLKTSPVLDARYPVPRVAVPRVTGVNVLRHASIEQDIEEFIGLIVPEAYKKLSEKGTASQAWRVLNQYHCGGYARVNKELLNFHKQLEKELSEPIDQVYMAKVLYALWCTLKAGELTDCRSIAVVHTGGQQGRRGLKE